MSLGLNKTEAGIKLNGGMVDNFLFASDIGSRTRSRLELRDIITQIDEANRICGPSTLKKSKL